VPADMVCDQILFEHCIDPREPEQGEAWLDMLSDLDKMQGFLATLHSRWHTSKGEQVDFWMNRAVAEPRRSPGVVSYGSVKDECAQTGETDGAELWFNLMVRAGVCPERGETQSSNRQWFPPAKWELRRRLRRAGVEDRALGHPSAKEGGFTLSCQPPCGL
jgi:pentatricopeptide repeat protein